ncbi:MAG: right-handed parallel beta-helix repeat-containing protein [Deltaproteobacteria bacterium]|nr:right-handed parallel beta-helix repeat-containing protein [Deltaproteobacteria bacterium]
MNDEIQNLLKEVVDEYGIYEALRPERCLELLSQKYGAIKEDFMLLSKAAEYGVAEELLKHRHQQNIDSVSRMLVSRLMVRMNLSENVAEYIINSWAYALGISDLPQNENIKRDVSLMKIVVGKSGEEGSYDSIYDAIRDISPGGEIQILPGIYYGHFKIRKPVRIKGVFREKVVLESDIMPVFTILKTQKVILEDLTLTGTGKTDYDKAHICEVVNSQALIKNCRISGATLSGLYVYGKSSDVRIENSEIEKCAKSGIVIPPDARCTVEYTRLGTCLDALITVRDYANLFLLNSKVTGGENTGIRLTNDANLYAESSEISYNKRAGITISYNSCSNIKNSSIHHNRGYGIIVSDMSCTTIENCQVYQNTVSGIRFDRSSDFFNYSSNVNDTVVTLSGRREDSDESFKSEAIDEYVKNPPDTSMENPPDTFQSAVIIISFVLIFGITALISAEIYGILVPQSNVNLPLLLTFAGISGVIAGLINIIRRG